MTLLNGEKNMKKRRSKKMFHHQEETLCNLARLEHSKEENRDVLDNTHYVYDPVEYQKNNRIYINSIDELLFRHEEVLEQTPTEKKNPRPVLFYMVEYELSAWKLLEDLKTSMSYEEAISLADYIVNCYKIDGADSKMIQELSKRLEYLVGALMGEHSYLDWYKK